MANSNKPSRPISATYNLTSNLHAGPKAVYGQYQAKAIEVANKQSGTFKDYKKDEVLEALQEENNKLA